MDRWKSTARKKLPWVPKGESQTREDAGAGKGGKVAKHDGFPMFCGSFRASKSRLAKAARPEPAGQMRDDK